MCGRAVLENPAAIGVWFDIHDAPEMTPRFNIAPSQPIAVIRTPHRLELLRWGIARERGRPPQINTRVESIAKSASRQRRCIIPVDAFYEWKKGNGVSQPFVIREEHGHPLALGGIWHSSRTDDGEVVESVSVLTRSSLPPLAELHERMPLMISREACERWLQADADVTDLLAPTTTSLVTAAVSSYVNSPKNEGPRCVELAAPCRVPSSEGCASEVSRYACLPSSPGAADFSANSAAWPGVHRLRAPAPPGTRRRLRRGSRRGRPWGGRFRRALHRRGGSDGRRRGAAPATVPRPGRVPLVEGSARTRCCS